MQQVRYFVAVVTVVAVPLGLLYWLVIHSWARRWRTWGARRTYIIVLPILAVTGALLFSVRGQLVGADLGTNWSLIGIAGFLCLPMIWLEIQYRKQLSISILVGIPEVSKRGNGRLLRDGIYGVVRHPRYLSAGIGLVVNALVANFLGLYLIILASVPVGYLMLILEERDLLDRFGDAYRQYQRDVPCLVPHPRRRK
jgi:methanethiol S-methyltransferase